jgi:hypothetical protein
MGHVIYLMFVVKYLDMSKTSQYEGNYPSSTRVGLLS